jgi:hypothetical protein
MMEGELARCYLKNKIKTKGLGCGSVSRVQCTVPRRKITL